jgi:hypothetical protein
MLDKNKLDAFFSTTADETEERKPDQHTRQSGGPFEMAIGESDSYAENCQFRCGNDIRRVQR